MRQHLLSTLLIVTIFLTACGGGGGGGGGGAGASGVSVISSITNTNRVWNFYAGDLNGDGLEDVVVGGWNYDLLTAYTYILTQNSDGTLTDKTSELLSNNVIQGNQRILISDFDSDGVTDIYFPGFGDGSAIVPANSVMFWGRQNSTYLRQDFSDSLQAHGACVADLNADGKPDMLVGGGVYINNGNRAFTLRTDILPHNYFESCAVIYSGGRATVYFGNIQTWTTPRDKIITFNNDLSISSSIGIQDDISMDSVDVVAQDLNQDGNIDFVVAQNSVAAGVSGSRYVINNNGDGTFTKTTILESKHTEYYARTLAIGSVPSVFFGADTNNASIFKGTVKYLPDSFVSFAGTSQSFIPAFVYKNSTTDNIFMLKLQNNTFYSKKM